MVIFSHVNGFEWDEGNINKNWEKHKVSHVECEEVFFNEPLIVQKDREHSDEEIRYFTLGRTNSGRLLFMVFTIRRDKMRVISARDMTRRECIHYEQIEKNT
ncbi:MAG: BrnT family toxin [bacterium]